VFKSFSFENNFMLEIPDAFVIFHKKRFDQLERLPQNYDLVAKNYCKDEVKSKWDSLYNILGKKCGNAWRASNILNQIFELGSFCGFVPVGSQDFNHRFDVKRGRAQSVKDVLKAASERQYPVLYLTRKGELIDVGYDLDALKEAPHKFN
jgi:hypothetical protein